MALLKKVWPVCAASAVFLLLILGAMYLMLATEPT